MYHSKTLFLIKHIRLHTQFISNMLTRGEMLSTRLEYDLILHILHSLGHWYKQNHNKLQPKFKLRVGVIEDLRVLTSPLVTNNKDVQRVI